MRAARQQNFILKSLLAGFMVVTPVAAHAAAALADENVDGVVTRYTPDFFSQYNPVTALDMVRQVPGFAISDGQQARGFGGTAGNVLINGERPSLKSTSLREILQRIALARVARIELIRGAVPGIDMRGQTRVVNVVLSTRKDGGQSTFAARANMWRDRVFFNGELTRSLRIGGADVTVNLQRNAQGRRPEGVRNLFDANGDLLTRRDEQDQRWFREWQPSFNGEKKFANGDALRLNGKYWNWQWNRNEVARISRVSGGALSPDGFDFNTSDNDGYGFEIGGDYERQFSKERSAKLIFVRTRRKRNSLDTGESFTASSFDDAIKIDSVSLSNETILRLLYDWTISPRHTVQFGTEGALNSLNSGLDLFEDNGTGFVQTILPVSNTKVREKRGEVFGSWVFTPSAKWTFESGLRYEYSQISQSGDASAKRTFKFPKPSFSVSWAISEKDQLRASAQRKVAQLDFGDFVSNINISDSQTNLGNPALEPDRTWALEASWERRFGEKGTINITLQRDFISAVQGRVPINNAFDGPGNLGNARRWLFRIETRVPLDRIGLKNATLDSNWFVRDSSVTDPVTGLRRELGGESRRAWSLDFRQDLNALKMAWGWNYNSGPSRRQFRLFEERLDNARSGNLGAFMETTRYGGVTTRLSVDNIFNQKEDRTRIFFAGSRALGIVDSIEYRRRTVGRRYRLSIKGTF